MGDRSRRLGLLLACLLCSTLSLFADTPEPAAEVPQLQVSVSEDQKGTRIQPRSIQMAVFFIENMSERSQMIQPEFILPTGWNPVMPPMPVTVGPGQRSPVYFSYQVPETALGGEQEILCSVNQPDGTVVTASQTVFIEYVYDINLRIMKSGLYTEAGETYSFDILLKNESNIESEFQLSIEEELGYPVSTDCDEVFSLGPQEIITIHAAVETDEDISESLIHEVEVIAQIVDMDIAEKVKTTMEVIPADPGESAYHMYPVSIKVKSKFAASDTVTNVNSVTISGAGSLFDDGSHAVEFAITPPAFPSSTFDLADTNVSLSYEQEGLYLYSGLERAFSITGLSSGSRTGLGFGGRYRIGETFSIEGNIVDPSSDEYEDSFGLGLVNAFSKDDEISLGLLAPLHAMDEGIMGMRARFSPYGKAQISGSFLMNLDDPDAFTYSLAASDTELLYDYSLSRSYKSAAYDESEHGVDTYSLKGTLKAVPNLKLTGSFDRSLNNISLLESGVTALTTQTIKFGAYWLPVSNLSIQLNQELYRQWDLMEQSSLQTQRDTTSIRVSYRRNNISLAPYIGIKNTRDLISDTLFSSVTARLNSDLTLNQITRLSSSITYDTGSNDPGISDSMITGSLSALFYPDAGVSINGGYARTYYPFDEDENLSSIRFGMSLNAESFGTLSFSLMNTLDHALGDTDTSVSFSYVLPLSVNVPVSMRTDIGSLRGRVYHKETGKPLKRVLVTVGDMSVLTDDEGNYEFKALIPGENTISVAAPDYKDYIVAGVYPIDITIEEEGEHVIDIPMVEKATISGNVLRFEKKAGTGFFMVAPEYYQDGGCSGLVVELTGEFGVRREATSSDGSFNFSSVVPGDVTLKVFTEQLPDTHELPENIIELHLEPGDRESIDFEVKPVFRQIQFVQEGVIAID